jgi:hypothetical protein
MDPVRNKSIGTKTTIDHVTPLLRVTWSILFRPLVACCRNLFDDGFQGLFNIAALPSGGQQGVLTSGICSKIRSAREVPLGSGAHGSERSASVTLSGA